MPESAYDCIVIGSGPGGYVAAIRAAQLGMSTAVIEKDAVGGRCLNYACIPAKAVLRVADILHDIDEADDFGISVPERTVDFGKVFERRNKVVKTLTGGVSGLFKKNKIEFIEGLGSLTKDGNVKVGRPGDRGAQGGDPRHRLDPQADPRHGVRRPRDRHGGGVGARGAAGHARRRRRRRVGRGDRLRLRAARHRRAAVRGARPRAARRRTPTSPRPPGASSPSRTWRSTPARWSRTSRARTTRSRSRSATSRARPTTSSSPPAAGRTSRALGLEEAGVKLDDRGLIEVDGALRTSAAKRLRDRRPRARAGARPQGLRRGRDRRRGRRRDGDPPDRVHRHPARDVLHARRRLLRPHRGAGARAGHRRRGRQGQLRRGRRRHGLRRPHRPDQDRRRQEVRRAGRRAHLRREGDRADPGAGQREVARGRLSRRSRASSTATRRSPRA